MFVFVEDVVVHVERNEASPHNRQGHGPVRQAIVLSGRTTFPSDRP